MLQKFRERFSSEPRNGEREEALDLQELPISVCVTTKNNQDTIRGCLESVVEWTEEIVIVDTGSEDGTISICEEYGQVYHHDFQGFGDLKNKAIDHAKNEWVFILDADEEVTAELRNEIIQKFNKTEDVMAFTVNMQNYMLGEPTHHLHADRPRLAKKEAIYWQQNYLWERLSIKDEFKDKAVSLDNHIRHYMFDRVSEMEKKFIQYSALEAIRIEENEMRDSGVFLFLKGIAIALQRLFVKRGVLDGRRGLYFAFLSFYHMVGAYMKLGDLRRIKKEKPDNWREIWLEEECQR